MSTEIYIVVYRESNFIQSVTDTISYNRISFVGNLIRRTETRLTRRVIAKLWKQNKKIGWMKEIREDMGELGIKLENLQKKTITSSNLKSYKIRFDPTID